MKKSCLVILFLLAAVLPGRSQSLSLHTGVISGPKGAGLSIETSYSDGKSSRLTISSDFNGYFGSAESRMGLRIQYTRNIVLLSKDSDMLSLAWLAGPGLVCGYTQDSGRRGVMAGISAGTSLDLGFSETPFLLRIGMSADVAGLVSKPDNSSYRLDFYKSGLRRWWIPELSIIYRF